MRYTLFKKALKPFKEVFLVSFILSSVFIGGNALVAGDESAELSTGLSNFLADIAEAILPEREPEVIPVQSLGLAMPNTNIYIGTSNRITPTVTPSNATDKSLVWSSDNTAVIEVTSGGIAVARDFGTATITAQSSHPDIAATITLNVIDFPDVSDFVMEAKVNGEVVTSIDVGTSAKIQLSQITPSQAKTSGLMYSSSDEGIATVNEDGVIVGLETGSVDISADFGEISKTITLTITTPDVPAILPDSLTLMGASTGYVGRSVQLVPDFGDTVPTDNQLTFKSNLPSVARVTDTGLVTGMNFSGLSARTVVISAYTNVDDSIIDTFEMTIEKVFPTTVTLSNASSFTAGQSLTIQPTFTPSDTTDRQLTWQSSNPELATVSSGGDFGLVVGKLSGTVTITATSVMDASIQATITLEILPAPLFSPAQWEAFLVFVRKGIGHFSLNMINGFLGFLTFYTYIDERKKYRDVLLSVLVGVPLSAFFESLQFFAPGRTPAWEDVFYNTSGYVTGQVVMMIGLTLIAWLTQRKHKQKKQ